MELPLLFSWMTLAQLTSLSGIAVSSILPTLTYFLSPTLSAGTELRWEAGGEEESLPFW